MEYHDLLQKFVLVVALGIGAQWVAWRLRLPAIVMLALTGVCAGPVLGWLEPQSDFGDWVHVLIKLSVAIILFEGGLNLRTHELKEIRGVVKRLVLLGIPIAWGLGFLCCYFVLRLSFPVSMLLSAILVVTGPTVIMPLVRHTRLSPRLATLFKWEGIINDPLGALLAVLVFEFFVASEQGTATVGIFKGIGFALLSGSCLGLGGGFLTKISFKQNWIPEFLKVPFILCAVILIYGASDSLQQESGLLAVTIYGFMVGNVGLLIIHELRRFKEYITLFLVSSVFIILASSLRLEDLYRLNVNSVVFLALVLFFIRPVSVWLATLKTDLMRSEKVMIGWIAPRGIVAATMAGLFTPQMIKSGYYDAVYMVPITFLVIFATVVLHGLTLQKMAEVLGLASNKLKGMLIIGASPWSIAFAQELKRMGLPVLLADNSWHRLREAIQKNIPVYSEEILSESSEETLDLLEMGYVFAVSDNDAYNALVCQELMNDLERDKVYQLPMHQEIPLEGQGMKASSRGKIAFKSPYELFLNRFYQGWTFQTVTVGEGLDEATIVECFDQKTLELLLCIQKSGRVVVTGPKESYVPRLGDQCLCFTSESSNLDVFRSNV